MNLLCIVFQSTYEYGKQLLQASLVLRRSLRYDLEPQKELQHKLNEAWKKFSQGDSETAARVNTLALFNKQTNEVESCSIFYILSFMLSDQVSWDSDDGREIF